MKAILATIPALLLAACQTTNDNIVTGPELTPVGTGLATSAREPLPMTFTEQPRQSFRSLWGGNSEDLFRDQRARNVGDIVTVSIAIDDKAEFENQSNRSRRSAAGAGFGASLGFGGFGSTAKAGDIAGDLDINSSTESRGSGSIDRSEKLRLSIAAVVTEVLPNGSLVIRGSQEVRVNHEIRVLHIGGIVRHTDITSGNRVAYDKIAEARISYGGRGRLTDVQQPALGQRIYDKVVPF